MALIRQAAIWFQIIPLAGDCSIDIPFIRHYRYFHNLLMSMLGKLGRVCKVPPVMLVRPKNFFGCGLFPFDEPNESWYDECKTDQGTNNHTGNRPFWQSSTVNNLACGACSVWGAWSERRNGKILDDQAVENQWRGIVWIVGSVFDKQTVWAAGQFRSLEGDQIVLLNRRALCSHRKLEERSVIDAILGRGIYSGVRIKTDCCYPCYLDTCTVWNC